ncbi:polysaccharide deacetylase family protein [Aureliella helgolandensis]|uniref:Polysaccharide deacetylase n=1 Tax=Aureliella helgolandensis TaxID=2527968 RepID=A0A518G693_9BACT|nr:polysaccharide deacetylase family protein [Aureliella helgolandensis]QDV24111.1 Polysaccharide deacetylase [Aureliella helgolandensis]
MSTRIKEPALWLYQKVTSRQRTRLFDRLQSSGRVPVAILFYHRIADAAPNDWTMNCKDFALQLDWLQDNFDVVSLQEAQNRIQSPTNTRPTVAISFDDGYSENTDFAIPELVRRGLTATYFVATDFVRKGTAFPHDIAAGCPLPPNTIEQLRQYVDAGIQIGAHTRTHLDLGSTQDKAAVRAEIEGSRRDLRDWLGIECDYFAFPFGLPPNTSQLAVDLIQELGFRGFCTAYGAWNWPGSEGTHLKRIHADPGLVSLRNWLTLDPRKLEDKRELPFSTANSIPRLPPLPTYACSSLPSAV